ncbi:MAG: hypothetical protein IJT30_04065 [Muribaculaceae bacterium]|nr:hypothetical protein [Muribaculaceae bacterium]
MKTTENLQVLDEVKRQGEGNSLKELVFNTATLEFEQVDPGAPITGTVVTSLNDPKDGGWAAV